LVAVSAEWVIDGYTFDLAPMAHILGEQLTAAEIGDGAVFYQQFFGKQVT
jgi:hypothetical protein